MFKRLLAPLLKNKIKDLHKTLVGLDASYRTSLTQSAYLTKKIEDLSRSVNALKKVVKELKK